MIVSYSHLEECPDVPPYCLCENRQKSSFQRRGSYFRTVARVLCHFFVCTRCRIHITMLPSSCVPYKHYPADEINQHLGQAVQGRSPHDIAKHDAPTMHESTIRCWLKEWIINSSYLASIASEKFSKVFQGGFRSIYQSLSQQYSREYSFRDIQPDLCREYPPVGVFRPLILLS